jgi:hypothetical protein
MPGVARVTQCLAGPQQGAVDGQCISRYLARHRMTPMTADPQTAHRLSVAPMMDWATDAKFMHNVK